MLVLPEGTFHSKECSVYACQPTAQENMDTVKSFKRQLAESSKSTEWIDCFYDDRTPDVAYTHRSVNTSTLTNALTWPALCIVLFSWVVTYKYTRQKTKKRNSMYLDENGFILLNEDCNYMSTLDEGSDVKSKLTPNVYKPK